MKSLLIQLTTFFAVAAVVLLVGGCATTRSDWEKTQQMNSVSAYRGFLRQHPQSEFSQAAEENIERLLWEKAKYADTLSAYQDFVNRYPKTKFLAEAKRRLDQLVQRSWNEAQRLDTLNAYRTFLRQNPENQYAEKAKEKIRDLEQKLRAMEENDWNKARKKNSTEGYAEFLKKYPEGTYAARAKTEIETRFEDDLKKGSGDLPSITRFVETHPTDSIPSSSQLMIENRFIDLVLASDMKGRFAIPEFAGVARKNIPADQHGRVTIFGTGQSGVVGLHMEYPVDRMPVKFPGGAYLPTGHGTVWRFKGQVTNIMGFNFDGDPKDCLRFLLVEGHGLVYLYGKGRVTLKDGSQVSLPPQSK